MLRFLSVLLIVSVASPQSGSEQPGVLKNDAIKWANKLGVTPSSVNAMVEAAGYSDEDEARIENLDIKHLKFRHQVFLVIAAGNGHCLSLFVLAEKNLQLHKSQHIKKVWEMSETPGGGGFCHSGAYTGNFRAHATADGRIVIDVPKNQNGAPVLPGTERLIYKWDGKTYILSD